MKNYHLLLLLILFFGNEITAQNPSLVKDIANMPGTWLGSGPDQFVTAGDQIFFIADDATAAGLEMWRSDGTQSGTQRLSSTDPQTWTLGTYPINKPAVLGDEVFWINEAMRNDPVNASIWKAGATGNAQKIHDYPDDEADELIAHNGYLYFVLNRSQLIRIDGNGGEELVYDGGNDIIIDLISVGTQLYFALNIIDTNTGIAGKSEIWSVNGSDVQFFKTARDSNSSRRVYLYKFNNEIAYLLSDPYSRDKLETFQASGFAPIDEEGTSYRGVVGQPVLFKGQIYYFTRSPDNTRHFQLKVQVGNSSQVVKDFPEFITNLTVLSSVDRMILLTSTGVWTSNGTQSGTKLLQTFDTNFSPNFLYRVGDDVIFSGWKDGIQSFWKTDGTDAGTEKFIDFSSGDPGDAVEGLPRSYRGGILKDNIFYYGANDRQTGFELWKLDLDAPNDLPPPPVFSRADLAMSAPSLPSNPLTAGTTINLDFVVQNEGDSDAFDNKIGVYLSTDRGFSADDELIAEVQGASRVSAGWFDSFNGQIRLPTNLNDDETYYLLFFLDYQNDNIESDETNNLTYRSFRAVGGSNKPDLVIDSIWTSDPFNSGDALYLTISNFASVDAPPCWVSFYFSDDDQLSSDDIRQVQIPVHSIRGGNPGGIIMSSRFHTSIVGQKFLIAEIDSRHEVSEINEDNNTNLVRVDVNPPPPPPPSNIDLELSFDALTNPSPDKWSVFSPKLTITNNGTETATGIKIHLPRPAEVIYQGGNEATTSQGTFKVYGSENWTVGDLAAGESATLEVNYFRLQSDVFSVYAQVIEADQSDSDSTPDNGTCCIANEDDEADISVAAAKPVFTRRDFDTDSDELFNINASPNPFSNDFILELISIEKTNSELLVFDATGKLVMKKAIDLAEGYNSILVDASDLPKGVFIAKIEGVGEKRLVKIRE